MVSCAESRKLKTLERLERSNKRLAADEEKVELYGLKPFRASESDESNSGITEMELNDSRAVAQIYDQFVKLEQWDESFDPDKGRFVNRLVRMKCFIEPCDRIGHERDGNFPETILCSMCLAVLEVFMIPMKYVTGERFYNPSAGEYQITPAIHGIGKELPDYSEVMYSTYRPVNDKFGVCLALRGEHSWLRDYMDRPFHWEYIQVED